MAMRSLPGFSDWFHDFYRHYDVALPCLWWPALMSERRSPSLLQRHYRWTLGFWHWRWSWTLVEQKPEPDIEFNDPDLALGEWVKWSTQWSKGRLSAPDLYALLEQEEQPWGRLVKFGAANYHYGRLILAREALAQSRTRKKDQEPQVGFTASRRSAHINLEMPDLSLPDIDPPARSPHQE